jgi:sugar phosphate isomerase/epimerase
MKLPGGAGHLTYCSNIHPGESWPEVRENLHRYVPQVKRAISPHARFGVGLRLSAQAARALGDAQALAQLRAILDEHDLYVFTLNGFPYGPFHGRRVKEDVYLPDWLDAERLSYTDALADLLAALLPDEAGLSGSVSSVPVGFKPAITTPEQVAHAATLLVRHVAHLVSVRQRTGKTIALALEPEPCCYLETIDEAVAFFESYLFAPAAVNALREATGLDAAAAAQALRLHLGLCLDLCHAAVEYESAPDMLARLRGAGINVAKLQLSSGLRIPHVTRDSVDLLRPFDDEVYLHQTIERRDARITRHVDLAQAFAALDADGAGTREWRIHFHVPLFLEELGAFSSTQSFLGEVLDLHRVQPISPHLEVETYTWGVLPQQYRGRGVVHDLVRELEWVLARLGV